MKLVIGQDNEGLWFFPKPGTSLWDVAAADALLRVMGGRISDRYGKDLDYQKGRMDAENIHGIIACIDEHLHTKCVELCLGEKWDHVQEQS
jgi:3''-Phosphoadenosine 5''-phosphosulfate (PAPS) 3''-phosphatase